MIRLLVDSASDYSMEELKRKQIEQVSLAISLDSKEYRGGIDLTGDSFYILMKNSGDFPKTSQPSPLDFLDIFTDVKEHGDSMICILLSSKLSGTYQSANLAKNMVEYDDIYIIDSQSATFPIKIMADYADKLRQEGKNAKEIVSAVESMKERVHVIAAVDTLEYLCRGGRLNRATAAVGELANLKPIITLSKEGTVSVIGKCLGRMKALNYLVKYLQDRDLDPDFPLYTLYTYGTENCEKMEDKMTKENFQITSRLQVGCTIGSHVGPGAFGIIFVEK